MFNNIRHIFWDLDHTLWDFDTNSQETLGELFFEFELAAISKRKEVEFFIERYLFHNERMWALYRENRISKSQLRKVRFELALNDIGIDDRPLAKAVGNRYMEVCPRKSALNSGAMEILTAFNGKYKQHILSNGFHKTQLTKLSSSGIDRFFESIITSETASAKKPNPPVYAHAMKMTGATRDDALMIGDNIDIDVKGAVDAGWKAIHYSPHGPSKHEFAVQNLGEISALLGG